MEEIWVDIKGYDGLYKVSNLARIFSVIKNRILKGHICKLGYHHVCLTKNGKEKLVKVHRLFAQAFIPNPENKPQINHKNGIKNENTIDNLEWCTQPENNLHALETGLRVLPNGENHYKSTLTSNDIIRIRYLADNKILNQRQIAKEYDMKFQSINDIVKRKNWKHI